MDHSPGQTMLGHRTSLNKFKTDSILSSFLNHSSMKLEINYKKTRKNANMWQLNTMLLNNLWIYEEIKEGVRKYLETNENGNTVFQLIFPFTLLLKFEVFLQR